MDELLLISIALFASLISGIFGFGAGITLITLGALFWDVKLIITIATTVFLVINISQVVLFWKNIDWKTVTMLILTSVPGAFFGARLMTQVDSVVIKKVLGVSVLVYVIFRMWDKHAKLHKTYNLATISSGASYGFLSGLVGAGGVIKMGLLDMLGLRKGAFVATSALSAIFINSIKLPVYLQSIDLSAFSWWFWVLFLSTGFIGPYIGKKYLKAMCPHVFQKIMLGFLAIIGLRFLLF